jgi:phage terminase Nu1 subunit (DNA packaging protein)
MDSSKGTMDTQERLDEKEIDFMKIFFMIKRHKWLIMSILGACILVGGIYILINAHSVSECKVALTFSGIDKHEYPNGKKFEMNDLIPSDAAVQAANVIQNPRKRSIFEKNPKSFLFVDPFIPVEVQEKAIEMKKVKKETLYYLPNQYYIRFIQKLGGPISGRERKKILYSLVQSFEQRFYDDFIGRQLLTIELPQDLIKNSDYIDAYDVLNNTAENYMRFIGNRIETAGYFQSTKTGKSFVDLQTELKNLSDIDLVGVDSLIYYYRLSKYKDFLLTRTQYKIKRMEQAREKKMLETEMVNNLLKQVLEKDKSGASAAMSLGTPNTQIVLDADTIDKLNQKEYLNLLIKRSLESGVESQNLGVDKKYLQEYIDLLQKSQGKEVNEASAKDFVEKRLETIRLELIRIAKAANELNKEYMTSRYSKVIMITEEPHSLTSYDKSPIVVMAIAVFAGIVISFVLAYILDLIYALTGKSSQ